MQNRNALDYLLGIQSYKRETYDFLHHIWDYNNSVGQNAQHCRIKMKL